LACLLGLRRLSFVHGFKMFIPIGALMSGAFLVIDTSSDNGQMIIGRVNQHRAMAGECSELDRHSYHSFNLSYSEWLAHVRVAPTDLRYL